MGAKNGNQQLSKGREIAAYIIGRIEGLCREQCEKFGLSYEEAASGIFEALADTGDRPTMLLPQLRSASTDNIEVLQSEMAVGGGARKPALTPTEREIKIANLRSQGIPPKEIAAKLGCTLSMVYTANYDMNCKVRAILKEDPKAGSEEISDKLGISRSLAHSIKHKPETK
jgi:hypothetical protein